MIGDWPWFLIAAVTVYLTGLMLYEVFRAFRGSAADADETARRGDDRFRNADSELVACQRCGAENERDYTFCSDCAAELSAG